MRSAFLNGLTWRPGEDSAMQILNISEWLTVSGIVEIFVLALLAYYVLSLFRGTRGAPILTGFVLVFVASIVLTHVFRLDTLSWLLSRFSVYLAVAVLVIFQPEIRQALADLGKKHLFGGAGTHLTLVDHITKAATHMSARRIGALIAIEQAVGTRAVQDTGIRLDCMVSSEAITTLFFPYTPLHDGGIGITGDRMAAAGCMFPLTDRDIPDKSCARAAALALRLSDESDAVIVVVSEETGAISIAHRGRMSRIQRRPAPPADRRPAAGGKRNSNGAAAEKQPVTTPAPLAPVTLKPRSPGKEDAS